MHTLRRQWFGVVLVALLLSVVVPTLVAQIRDDEAICAQRIRNLTTAFVMYLQDYDEIMPLAFGRDRSGTWLSQYSHPVPHDWRTAQSGWRDAFASMWANALIPYLRHPHENMHCPTAIARKLSSVSDYANPLRRPLKVSYTYNGLLHQLAMARVEHPATVPAFWEGLGRSYLVGFALSNPRLNCSDPAAECRYVPRRSEPPYCPLTGTMLTPDSLWIHPRGVTMAFVDTHVQWRRLGLVTSPNDTNPEYDPYTGYNSSGVPSNFWWDGCYPLIFRPY